MRTKWITLAVAGSLGLSIVPAAVCDDSTDAFPQPASSQSSDHDKAQELLGRSLKELDAGRFNAARALVKQAEWLGASYSLFDLRPEQVQTQIDRRERNALAKSAAETGGEETAKPAPTVDNDAVEPAAKPAPVAKKPLAINEAAFGDAPPDADAVPMRSPAHTLKAAPKVVNRSSSPADRKREAIVLLDQGLQALDEKRLDEAERCAVKASALAVQWDKYEYRPQNLLDDVRSKRVTAAAATADVDDAPQALPDPFLEAPIESRKKAMRTAGIPRTRVDVAAPAVTPEALKERDSSGAHATMDFPQRDASPKASAVARNAASEKLLQQAVSDLHAGRDAVARDKIERALGTIPGGKAAVYPLRQSELDPAMARVTDEGADPSVAPMHDRFLGDVPSTTGASNAGERTLREATPQGMAVRANYLPKHFPASVNEDRVRQAAYESPAQRPQAPRPSMYNSPAATPLSPKVDWLERNSVPITPETTAAAAAAAAKHDPASYYRHGLKPAPIAPPVKMDGKWTSPGRIPTAPPGSTEEEKPGIFKRMWNTMRGE